MRPDYRVVFDLASRPIFPDPQIFLGVAVFVAIAAIVTFTPALVRGRRASGILGRIGAFFSWFFLTFFILFAIVVIGGAVLLHELLVSDEEKGLLPVTEGCLQFFHPMPFSGHDRERFSLNGMTFSYTDYEVTQGFNQTESHGGPVHANSLVRVVYSGDLIVRLEVANQMCPAASDGLPELWPAPPR